MTRRRVDPERRAQAFRQAAETARIVRQIIPRALRIMQAAQSDVLAAIGTRRDPLAMLAPHMRRLGVLIAQAMTVARLLGVRRAQIAAPSKRWLSLAKPKFEPGDVGDAAIRYLSTATGLTPADLAAIEQQMKNHALRIGNNVTENLQRRVQQAMLEITEKNLHVEAGTEVLANAFKSAGATPENQFTLEAIFRTQTQLAYAAGREDFAAQPAIQEILWGYTYVTVGDDRVRPEHALLDGTTLPKDDPFWTNNSPPNGFACRCQRIEVYEPEQIVPPPTGPIEVDGIMVTPGADPGFRSSARSLFSAIPPKDGKFSEPLPPPKAVEIKPPEPVAPPSVVGEPIKIAPAPEPAPTPPLPKPKQAKLTPEQKTAKLKAKLDALKAKNAESKSLLKLIKKKEAQIKALKQTPPPAPPSR